MLARRALYHLSHAAALVDLIIFLIGSHFCLGLISDRDSPTCASSVSGITGVYHPPHTHTPGLFFEICDHGFFVCLFV
jgi:hypothetical protein